MNIVLPAECSELLQLVREALATSQLDNLQALVQTGVVVRGAGSVSDLVFSCVASSLNHLLSLDALDRFPPNLTRLEMLQESFPPLGEVLFVVTQHETECVFCDEASLKHLRAQLETDLSIPESWRLLDSVGEVAGPNVRNMFSGPFASARNQVSTSAVQEATRRIIEAMTGKRRVQVSIYCEGSEAHLSVDRNL